MAGQGDAGQDVFYGILTNAESWVLSIFRRLPGSNQISVQIHEVDPVCDPSPTWSDRSKDHDTFKKLFYTLRAFIKLAEETLPNKHAS